MPARQRAAFGRRVVEQPLTWWQRLGNQGWLRKALTLVVIAGAWEIYARWLDNPLLVPTFAATLDAFVNGMLDGELPQKVANSVLLLLKGYALGLGLAMVFTALAMMSRVGNDLLETLTSAFNPLPAIAEFREFQAGLNDWLAGPPVVEQLEVRGAYAG